jgi:hypothetical protein
MRRSHCRFSTSVTRGTRYRPRLMRSCRPALPSERGVRPDGPGGRRSDPIVVATSSPTTPSIRIVAHTYLRNRVYVFPDSVDLGSIDLARATSKPDLLGRLAQTLMVYQTDGTEFRARLDTDVRGLALGLNVGRGAIDIRSPYNGQPRTSALARSRGRSVSGPTIRSSPSFGFPFTVESQPFNLAHPGARVAALPRGAWTACTQYR